MIGVATAELRNKSDKYRSNNNMCIYANGYLCSDDKLQNYNFELKTGDVITIKYN